MIRVSSMPELIEAFREIDRPELALAVVPELPLTIRDYHCWSDSGGHRAFLVYKDPERRGQINGIVLRRSEGAGVPGMCEWCHRVRGSGEISLMVAAASAKRRVGAYVCRDLGCKSADDAPELIAPQERVRRIVERMSTFARRHLF